MSNLVLFGIAESCPFDAILVRDMRRAVNSLVQLNMKRFRVPDKTTTKYSALDVMKQALELLFEFAPSEKNYREAMRTMQVYSEGDEEMLRTLRTSFRFIANAVYNTYVGQRRIESLAPTVLFCEGIQYDSTELQQAFRYVGVKPPETYSSIKKTVFLDEGFEPYRQLLDGKITSEQAEVDREEQWSAKITSTLSSENGSAVIRVGTQHLEPTRSHMTRLRSLGMKSSHGKFTSLLLRKGIEVEVVERIADVNEAFGKAWR
jgi:hypothetical protein